MESLAKKYFPAERPARPTAPRQRRFDALAHYCGRGRKPEAHPTDERNELGGDAHPISPPRPGASPGHADRGTHLWGLGPTALEIQRQIAAVDPSIPTNDVEALPSRLAKTLAYRNFGSDRAGCLRTGALLLSAVGLHGVLSQLVAQRMPEFGVRRAVGAQTHDLLFLIARQGGIPVLAGLGAGVCLTLAFSRLLSNLLYGINRPMRIPSPPYR